MSIPEALKLFVQLIIHAHQCGRADCAKEENTQHKEVMAKFNELAEQLTVVAAQVNKAKTEIISATQVLQDKVSALEAAITNGDVPENVLAAFNEVKSAAQAVDDLNPDA
jgi:seryl-tRNA synthetase